MSRCVLVLFALVFLFCRYANGDVAKDWSAGAAKVAITPDEFIWMAGYASRDRPADGKLTELWAKALVMEDGCGHRGLVITLDLVGIDRTLSQVVCEALEQVHGFAREQIVLCCSHTHTGPVVAQNLAPLHYLLRTDEQREAIDRWSEQLVRNIVSVAGEALANRQSCNLSWGIGRSTFAVNRRENRPEANVPDMRLQTILKGPVDHDVPLIAVRDKNAKLVAVLFGYACHATTLSSYQWSGDYPGYAQMELEENHPDCIALFFAGCGADQNPLPRRSPELARHYGQRLATAVDAVLLTSKMHPISPALRTSYEEVEVALAALPTRQEIEQNLQSQNPYEAARARMLLEKIDHGTPLKDTYPYPVSVWGMGAELNLVFLGGEVVVDYAIRLKSELGEGKTLVAGYSNDVMAYIPSRRILAEGGYEGGGAMVYYGLPAHWSERIELEIVDNVHQQVNSVRD